MFNYSPFSIFPPQGRLPPNRVKSMATVLLLILHLWYLVASHLHHLLSLDLPHLLPQLSYPVLERIRTEDHLNMSLEGKVELHTLGVVPQQLKRRWRIISLLLREWQ